MGADNVRNGVRPGAGKIGDQVGDPPALVLVGLFADGEARRLKGPAHVILGLSEAVAAKYRAFADVPGQRPHVTTERHLEGIGVVADHRGEPENEGGEQGECQKHGMEGPSFHLTYLAPLTSTVVPVAWGARPEARKQTTLATSSGGASWPMGISAVTRARAPGSVNTASAMSVST